MVGEDNLPMEEGRRESATVPVGDQQANPTPGKPSHDGEGLEGKHHEKTGTPSQQKRSTSEIIKELNSSYEDVQTSMSLLTPQFMRGDKQALDTKKAELATVMAVYKREYSELDISGMAAENKELLGQQRDQMFSFEKRFNQFFDEAKALQQLGGESSGKTSHGGQENVSGGSSPPDPKLLENQTKHAKEVQELKKEIDQLRADDAEKTDQIIGKYDKKVDQLRADYEGLIQKADRRISQLEGRLDNYQQSEISYDEVDHDEAEIQNGDPRKEQTIANLKLDTVQLPYFDGKLEEWPNFRDMFEYLVDKSGKLSKVVKFHQLIGHLKASALECIKGYKVTGSNYEAAWADLKKRYDRTDELIEDYIRRFLEVPAIRHKATHVNLRAIIDVTNQMLRALPAMKTKVDQWDPFLNFIVKTKLDEETRSEWKQKLSKDQKKAITDLLDFMEIKATDIQPGQAEKLSQMLSCDIKRKPNNRVFQITEKRGEAGKSECSVCQGAHNLKDCFKFRRMDARTRTSALQKRNLCFRCFQQHKSKECKLGNCPHCEKPHHSLLCYKKEAEKRSANQNQEKMEHKNAYERGYQSQQNQPSTSGNYKQQGARQDNYKETKEDWARNDWNQSKNSNN